MPHFETSDKSVSAADGSEWVTFNSRYVGQAKRILAPALREKFDSPISEVVVCGQNASEAWLRDHSKEYVGNWVALNGSTLVASGPNGKDVYNKARTAGVKRPVLMRITHKGNPSGGL
jgi:hypothetical protein